MKSKPSEQYLKKSIHHVTMITIWFAITFKLCLILLLWGYFGEWSIVMSNLTLVSSFCFFLLLCYANGIGIVNYMYLTLTSLGYDV
ncbi:hypothetical protein PBI_SCTP2_431 [Salicola phage SCTP-2]|nr:hypothetical protein PBI_SCTP2_431 [Salicola phage SCTP-2]